MKHPVKKCVFDKIPLIGKGLNENIPHITTPNAIYSSTSSCTAANGSSISTSESSGAEIFKVFFFFNSLYFVRFTNTNY